MQTETIPSQAYREVMPDSSNQAKNLDDFRAGLAEIENPTPPEPVIPPVVEPDPEPTPEPEPEPEPSNDEPVPIEAPDQIDTPLGKVDLPGKKKEAEKAPESAEVVTPEPDESDEDIGKQFPKKDKDARHEFIRMRKEIKSLVNEKKELETLKTEVEQLRSKKPEVNLEEIPEYQTAQNELKQAREALEARDAALREAQKVVAIADFKKTPEYQQAVVEPWEKKVGPAIAQLAKERELDPPLLFSLVQTRDPAARKAKFNEIVQDSEMDTFDQQQLIGYMRDYDSIMERHGVLEQNSLRLAEMSESERKTQSEAGMKQYQEIVSKSRADYRPKLEANWFPNLKDDPELAQAVKQATDIVDKADWWQVPPDKHAVIMETAMKAPILQKMLEIQHTKAKAEWEAKEKELVSKLKTAEDTVKKLSKSTPQAGGKGASEKIVDNTKIERDEKFGVADAMVDF